MNINFKSRGWKGLPPCLRFKITHPNIKERPYHKLTRYSLFTTMMSKHSSNWKNKNRISNLSGPNTDHKSRLWSRKKSRWGFLNRSRNYYQVIRDLTTMITYRSLSKTDPPKRELLKLIDLSSWKIMKVLKDRASKASSTGICHCCQLDFQPDLRRIILSHGLSGNHPTRSSQFPKNQSKNKCKSQMTY